CKSRENLKESSSPYMAACLFAEVRKSRMILSSSAASVRLSFGSLADCSPKNVRSLCAKTTSYTIECPSTSGKTPDPSRPLLGTMTEKCATGDSKLVHRLKLPFCTSGLNPCMPFDEFELLIRPITSPFENDVFSRRNFDRRLGRFSAAI